MSEEFYFSSFPFTVSQAADKLESQIVLPAQRTLKPVLIILVGLPGAGKSTLARAVAQALPAAVVEADFVRKTLFAAPAHDKAENWFVHRVAHELIARLLRRGYSAISDATNLFERHREFLYRMADLYQAGLLIVRVVAPEPVIQQRLAERLTARDPRDLSDATWQVYQRMLKNQDALGRPCLVAHMGGAEDLSKAVIKVVRAARRASAA